MSVCCQLAWDGDPKDVRDAFEQPVVIASGLRIPRYLEMIAPDEDRRDDLTGGGAAGNNMVQATELEYDGGTAGGDNLLTKQTQFV